MANIVLVDDHSLLRTGLATLVESLGFTVSFEASNGIELINKLTPANIPDVVLMDINMPEMDGFQTTRWLKDHYPKINVLALSMYDNETSIIRMLKCGAKGYILKDSEPAELKAAITAVLTQGYHYSDVVSGKLIHVINQQEGDERSIERSVLVTNKEKVFLQYTCSELTYKEIAAKMVVSPRTVDGYRDALFDKLRLKTRVGLVLYAIKNGLADLSRE